MNTTLATIQVSPVTTMTERNNSVSSISFFPMGEMKLASDFLAPRYGRTLSTKIESGTKWWLAKDLKPDQLPIMREGFNLQFTDLKQKGFPLFPQVEHREGVVYVVFFKPQFSLWSKVRKCMLKVPDEIQPYYVLPPADIQYAPLYHLRHRLAGFKINAMAIATERVHTGTIQFNWNNAGRSEKYIYAYSLKGRLEDPIRFCHFCQADLGAEKRFENEVHIFFRARIETLFLQNDSNAGFSEKSAIPKDYKFFQEIGYAPNVEYELYYESTLKC